MLLLRLPIHVSKKRPTRSLSPPVVQQFARRRENTTVAQTAVPRRPPAVTRAYERHDSVSEWLKKWTRNQLVSARNRSNPLAVALPCLRPSIAGSRLRLQRLSRNQPAVPVRMPRPTFQLQARKAQAATGFEPTRGSPIGLAGRRLSHSAKVLLAMQSETQSLLRRSVCLRRCPDHRHAAATPPPARLSACVCTRSPAVMPPAARSQAHPRP